MRNNLKLIADLFFTFAEIGLFTFGGGYAMISMIQSSCVDSKKWITHDEMMNITVIAESTPGPIAINCATYVGHKQAGFSGAMAATLGIVFPSFVVIMLVSGFISDLLKIPAVSNAFTGIKIAASLLIINAALNMLMKLRKNNLQSAIIFSSLILVLALNIPSVMLMICSALLGVFLLGGRLSNS